jgi:hypothetical protein
MDIIVLQEKARVPVTVLRLTGRLDAMASEELIAIAEKEIQNGSTFILLDFDGVNYMSSAGFRSINHIFDRLRPHSAASDAAMQKGVRDGSYKSPNLKLVNAHPLVLTAMRTIGIDMFLEIHADYPSAVASF